MRLNYTTGNYTKSRNFSVMTAISSKTPLLSRLMDIKKHKTKDLYTDLSTLSTIFSTVSQQKTSGTLPEVTNAQLTDSFSCLPGLKAGTLLASI